VRRESHTSSSSLRAFSYAVFTNSNSSVVDKASEYKENRELFNEKAREYTRRYASPSADTPALGPSSVVIISVVHGNLYFLFLPVSLPSMGEKKY
jgi:hypothetical protein